jgi:hypothetical protein
VQVNGFWEHPTDDEPTLPTNQANRSSDRPTGALTTEAPYISELRLKRATFWRSQSRRPES